MRSRLRMSSLPPSAFAALVLFAVPVHAAEPAAARDRARAIAEFTPPFKALVFEGETFPELTLDRKKLEGLLGEFTARVTWYDHAARPVKAPGQPGAYGAVVELTPKAGRPVRRFVTLYRLPAKAAADLRFDPDRPADFARALRLDADVVRRQSPVLVEVLGKRPFSQWSGDSRAARGLAGLSFDRPSKAPPHKYDDALALERQWWVGIKRKLNGWDKQFPKPFVAPVRIKGEAARVVRTGTAEEAGVKADTADKVDAACRAFADDTDQAFSVCIVRHGVIVLHKAYGTRDGKPMTVETKSWMASVTKTMSASLMMMAVDQGLVDLDDPVEKFLPSLKGIKVEKPLKVRHLYTHTGGLGDWPGWDDQMADVEERLAAYYDQLAVGKEWKYTGTGNMLGSKALEAISGEALPQFFEHRLLGPLGCTRTDVVGSHADAYSVPLDMAKFGQMLLNRGAYGEWRFFRPQTFEKMLPRTLTEELGPDAKKRFGLGLDGSPQRFGHGAASAATFHVDVEKDLVIVITRNKQGKNQDKYGGQIMKALNDGLIDKK